MPNRPFEILLVCTGNVCRSPAAEYLLRDVLDSSVLITSAGTTALKGHGVDPQMAALLSMDSSAFSARQLSAVMPSRADLILGMAKEHRRAAVLMHPAAVRRTFTLREFARLVASPQVSADLQGTTHGQNLSQLTPRAARARPMVRAADETADDIPDPYRQPAEVFTLVFEKIAEAVRSIAIASQPNTPLF